MSAPLYGRCKTCGLDLPTQEDSRAHQDETFAASKAAAGGRLVEGVTSHTVTILNPSPENAARYAVHDLADRALVRFVEDVEDAIGRGRFTAADVRDALRGMPDFEDAWTSFEAGEDQ